MTQEGLDELKAELDELVNKNRPVILVRLADARDMGDLSENAEYIAARDELAFIDGRIDEIEEIVRQVEIIKHHAGKKTIALGSKVTLHVGKKQEVFTVVGEWEADPMEKKISHESPLGKALLNKSAGDKVEVDAPAGKVLYTVVEIH